MTNAVCFEYYGLFTCWMVFVFLLEAFTLVHARSPMVVSRMYDGDGFTNPHSDRNLKDCAKFEAHCVKDLLNSCNECKCKPGNETYRLDLERCISSEDLDNYTDCNYKGEADDGNMDAKISTLNLMIKGTKNIIAPLHVDKSVKIKCGIGNESSFLNRNGKWIILKNISQALRVDVKQDQTIGTLPYLILNWEEVNEAYWGLVIKLQIVCKSVTGYFEKNCFLFKTIGRHIEKVQVSTTRPTVTTTAKLSIPQNSHPTTHAEIHEHTTHSSPTTQRTIPTKKNVVKNNAYSVSRTVIIAVSASVGFVIITVITLAICCVRHRMRKSQENRQNKTRKKDTAVHNDVPKVHFTAQTRFSLIRESVHDDTVVEPNSDDYTCLQQDREKYDSYCSLRKDDLDLNLIDQILKEAVSLESMEPSSEPRYNCRLSGDKTVISLAVPRPSSSESSREYNVLEEQDDAYEHDYEQVGSSDEDDVHVATKLLADTKPPLPERHNAQTCPAERPSCSEC